MRLDETILQVLFNYFDSQPDAETMPFLQLCQEVWTSSSPSDIQKRETRGNLRGMKEKDWVDCLFTSSGNAGSVKLKEQGHSVAKQLLGSSELESFSGLDSEGRPTESGYGDRNSCPISLDELAEIRADLARIIRHDNVLNQIIVTFRFTDNHVVLLIGQPMVGKSMLLTRVCRELADEYVPLRLSLETSPLTSTDAFTLDLTKQWRMALNRNVRRGRCNLSGSLRTLEKTAFSHGRGEDAFFEYWNDFLDRTDGKLPLVMIDEVEKLADKSDILSPDILPFLQRFLYNADNGNFILVGSERIHNAPVSDFRAFVQRGFPILVPYYDEAVPRLAFSALQDHFTFEDATLEHCIALCDGHPHLLRILFAVVVSHVREVPGKREVNGDDLEEILIKLLRRTKEQLHRLGQPLSRDERFVISLISQYVSSPTDKLVYSLQELRDGAEQQFVGMDGQQSINQGVLALVDRGWMKLESEMRETIRFKLGLFLFWLRRYQIDLMRQPVQ